MWYGGALESEEANGLTRLPAAPHGNLTGHESANKEKYNSLDNRSRLRQGILSRHFLPRPATSSPARVCALVVQIVQAGAARISPPSLRQCEMENVNRPQSSRDEEGRSLSQQCLFGATSCQARKDLHTQQLKNSPTRPISQLNKPPSGDYKKKHHDTTKNCTKIRGDCPRLQGTHAEKRVIRIEPFAIAA